MTYTPDEWTIAKITGTNPHYRIFASWRGGYLNGDSWLLNSGVVAVEVDEDYYVFKGHSGSYYYCHKEFYGISSYYNAPVLAQYIEKSGGKMEELREMPEDLINFDWIISDD